jgi:ABC-type transport system involved in multi-copper enzyme maturation permease subunit
MGAGEARERVAHIQALTWAALVESLRRKDLYVVGLLAVASLAAGGMLASLGVRGIETFIRDVTLGVVNLLSTLLCIWLAARQFPDEISRRTLFPLLARPVRRIDVLLGKFLAVWIASVVALLALAAAAWITLVCFQAAIGPIFWQYLLLRAFSFAPIAALTIALSLVLSTPAATVVLATLLTLFGNLFARTLAETVPNAAPAAQAPLKLLYFLAPHLDLFDLSARAAYNYPALPAWVPIALTGYGALYAAVFLALGELRFRRIAV